MDFMCSLFGWLLTLYHVVLQVRGEDASECRGIFDASEAGYITSPGYPLEYPPHQNCQWVITAPEPSQRIVLNFNPHFEIERLDCKRRDEELRHEDMGKKRAVWFGAGLKMADPQVLLGFRSQHLVNISEALMVY